MMTMRSWFREWWSTVPEPRELSMVWTAMYVVVGAGSVGVAVYPPQSLVGALDSYPAVLSMCLLMFAGAVCGAICGYREYFRGERIALLLMAAPTCMYAVITVIMHFSQPGSRLWTLTYVALAGVLFGGRYVMIRVYTRRPGSSTRSLETHPQIGG